MKKVTIKNIATGEKTNLDEEQSTLYTEGLLEMDSISGVDSSNEDWDSLVEEIWSV